MRKFLKRIRLIFNVKKFVPFLLDFAVSKEVPLSKKILSLSLVGGYFLLPLDLIPDFLVLFGILDDVTVLAFVLQQIVKMAPESLIRKHRLDV